MATLWEGGPYFPLSRAPELHAPLQPLPMHMSLLPVGTSSSFSTVPLHRIQAGSALAAIQLNWVIGRRYRDLIPLVYNTFMCFVAARMIIHGLYATLSWYIGLLTFLLITFLEI
jgi:hypothetical protein